MSSGSAQSSSTTKAKGSLSDYSFWVICLQASIDQYHRSLSASFWNTRVNCSPPELNLILCLGSPLLLTYSCLLTCLVLTSMISRISEPDLLALSFPILKVRHNEHFCTPFDCIYIWTSPVAPMSVTASVLDKYGTNLSIGPFFSIDL